MRLSLDRNIQNDVFFAYAYHQQQLEDIVNEIISKAYDGELNFNIDLSGKDNLSENDLQYIREEVTKRL
jgi:hypothetical protein